jgi:hypothetical protein
LVAVEDVGEAEVVAGELVVADVPVAAVEPVVVDAPETAGVLVLELAVLGKGLGSGDPTDDGNWTLIRPV